MPHAIQRIDLAGRDVTDHLQLLIRKAGTTCLAEKEVVRTIKEKTCYLSANPVKEEKDHAGAWEFRLPDGKVIQLGTERFLAPEILFNPELVGQEYPGVHQVIVDYQRTDMDLRKALFSNIVLSGGSTLCTGECGLCCRILTLRLWRQAAQRGQEDCAQGRQAQDLRATRTKVLDLDWRQYLSRA
jgi:centractin